MERYWEREAHLFQGFTADDIADVERHFAKVRIQFSMNPSLQSPDDQLSILNYRREIEDICQYRFRLVFPSPSMAETVYVYANFRRYVAGPNRLDLVPSSMKLLPLRDLCWYNPTSTFFHPQAISAATLVDTKVRIDRLPPLTATNDILAALRGSRLPTPDVDITGDGYVTLTFDTPAPVAFLWSTSGPHGDTRLYIRDIAVHLHILTGRPRQPAAPLQCRDCGRHDHQGQPCDRFTYLDPRDRAHSKSHHKSTTRRDIHTQPRHEPAQYKSPPPRGTPHTLRLHLSLYLQRELSTTWINASYRPRAHSDGRLSPSALTKKPSLHLSPPQALISSTLDARLLEERRLREAAELLQAEDNRLRTAAHIRLNTAEWQWLTQATTQISGQHHFVLMAGDFNTYDINPLDLSALQPRSGPSLNIGTAFQQWMQSIGLLSTFRKTLKQSKIRLAYAQEWPSYSPKGAT
ncbi:hypothetical protein DYB34_008114 [Aphanomyces astaci]|uniref:Uncharacterized protein n=3 Tax=Aphanomyces astaci TaxID=112090 RepID=A0A397FB21_APHAT|nr:hypothetical protein DYB34_008114 [Aphanomyces astaci]RHZ23390.1 hypothetical protein DYB31_006872 [Aphanomyces astaci]